MEVIVGRAERRLDLRPDRRALQGAAVVPAPLVDGERPHAGRIQGRLEAEADQQARGVGADLDAGADLADARRLLVDMDVEPGLQQMQGGRQAANAAADDGDFHATSSSRPEPSVARRSGGTSSSLTHEQVPPLRFAPVGMTGSATLSPALLIGRKELFD